MKKPFLTIGCLVLLLAACPLLGAQQNIALGAGTSESDPGWGGGSYPADMVDGLTYYTDTWAHGLAFTGGPAGWGGEACGWRQATLDFGAPKTFSRALVWHHGADHIPSTYDLEVWDGSSWVSAGGTSSVRWDLEVPPAGVSGWGAIPTEHLFPEVTAQKVRFVLNNCNITHGWIYEFEVFGGSGPQYRLPFTGRYEITNGPGCGTGSLRHDGFTAEAIDYALPVGTEVLAAEAGDVVFAGSVSPGGPKPNLSGFGTFLIIRHDDGSQSYYAHLLQPLVTGGRVTKGQLIAWSGESGKAQGHPHLHFQIMDSNQVPIPIRTLPVTTWYSGDPNNPCNKKPKTLDGYAVGPAVP